MNPGLTEEQMREAAAAIAEHNTKKAAAQSLGLAEMTFHNRLKRAAEAGLMGYEPVLPGFRVSQTTAQYNASGDLERQSVQQKPERGERFSLPAGQKIKGVSALLDPDGHEIIKWIKTAELPGGVDFVDVLGKALTGLPIANLPAPAAFNDDDLLVVYPIVDLHLGLYAWAPEAGADYDLTIASDLLKSSVANLVARSANAGTALILDMGDYFHSDSSRNQTAKSGNTLDVDGRRSKIAQVGVELTAEVIDLALQKHASVIYRKLPGNHDEETSPMLAIALAMRYRDNPRVTILTEASRHFMHQHGEVMIAATHGDMLKMGDMAGFMAGNWPKVWGATEFRYAYTGHIHHDSVKSGNGVRAESFNTLAAKDAWHAASGYVSQRSAVSITMHKTGGEIDRLTVNLPSFRRAA